MKIKQEKGRSILHQRFHSFFRTRRSISIGIIGFIGLVLVSALFFAVLGYGAYLKKVGETKYYKHALLRIADLDFSFISNYAKGKTSDFDKIDIDIKFKHMSRLRYLREQALEEGFISAEIKAEEFPATLTYNGHPRDVKISLTGMMIMHLTDPLKWSFQVKVRGDETIEGMKRFGLLLPHTRGYLTDWLAMELMKDRGLMALRVDFTNVSINGKPMGIFYLEERFDKYMLENNRLREGIIFKLQEDLHPYQEQDLMANPESRAQLLQLRRMWQEVMAGNLEAGEFFDLKKMAKLFAITDLMNSKHALYRNNLRFYFNPITGLVEPIAREWGSLSFKSTDKQALFLERPQIASMHYNLERDTILKMIYNNLEFKSHYLKEAEALSNTDLLDQLLKRNGDKLNALVTKVYQDWPFYELPTHALYENQRYMKSRLFSDVNSLSAYFDKKENNHINLYLRNQQSLPLEVFHLSWRDSIIFYPEHPIILDNNAKDQSPRFQFKIPPRQNWADSLILELKIHYNILGMESGRRSALVFPWQFEDRLEHIGNPVVKNANYNLFDFIKENGENEIIIPAGYWTIAQDLIIPAEKRFVVEAGAQIDLINHARIICHSPIFCYGSDENPILIHSSDTTGQGILVIRAEKTSILAHSNFDYLSRPEEDGWQLSGAVTFYESPVDISYCTFSNNQIGDDFLNIIRSDFSIDQSQFKGIFADALDCDFTKGVITNSSFIDIGNDAVDVSGTEVDISHVFMNYIGDKGLSAGEDSQMSAKWIDIRNAEIGVTSKDKSKVFLSDATLLNCRVGITLFQKKSEFGPGQATIDRVKITQSEIPYLIEGQSRLVLDGQDYLLFQTNVKELLYGAEFGKSSN